MSKTDGFSERLAEYLVPTEWLQTSKAPKWDLSIARGLMSLLYCGLFGVLLYTLYHLLFSGRIEVVRTGYKVDVIEAPSMAICPFWDDTAIQKPLRKNWTEGTRVRLSTLKKESFVDVQPYECDFDRACVCVDLFKKKAHGLFDRTELRDYEGERSEHTGPHGEVSIRENKFRDSIELRTDLTDPSGDQTLKIGLYDSVDGSPNWFFVKQGSYCAGTLEVQAWTVTDMSFRGIADTLKGNLDAMAKRRLIYRFISEDVGERGRGGRQWNETRLSYEMTHFFVDETVSSETAWSGWTLLMLVFIFLLRAPIIHAFIDVVLPAKRENQDVDRELAGWAVMAGKACCCCCMSRADEEEGLDKPLIK